MQDAQWWRVFPIYNLPGNQRMSGFRGANKSCVLLAIVLFPSSKLFLAMAVAHGIEIFRSDAFGGAVAQGIEVDGIRGSREGIAAHEKKKKKTQTKKKKQVAKKEHQHKHASADSDRDLYAGKAHVVT